MPKVAVKLTEQSPIDLVDSARICIQRLGALQQHAVDRKARHRTTDTKDLIEHVDAQCQENVRRLREWKDSITRSNQTSDIDRLRTVAGTFDHLRGTITEAEEALNSRLGIRSRGLNAFPSRK